LLVLPIIFEEEFTMRVKKTNREQEPLSIEFCTECNEALDDFALTQNSSNKKAIHENFSNCKKTGKFKGEFCSKIFISEEQILNNSSKEED